jgi:hypothetical protein
MANARIIKKGNQQAQPMATPRTSNSLVLFVFERQMQARATTVREQVILREQGARQAFSQLFAN